LNSNSGIGAAEARLAITTTRTPVINKLRDIILPPFTE
jgi:hypothetical protein